MSVSPRTISTHIAERRAEAHRPASGPRILSSIERAACGIAGAGLLASGLIKPSKLGLLMDVAGGGLLYQALTGHSVVHGVSNGMSSQRGDGKATVVAAQRGVHFDRSITVNCSPQEAYAFWRDLTNLPHLIDHLRSVTPTADNRSHWVAEGPYGMQFEWDAEIDNERDGEFFSWRSVPDSALDTAGSAHFASLPADRGTAIRLVLKFDPPGGQTGNVVGKLFGRNVEAELFEGLRRMKHLLEAKEIPSVTGQPQGRCGRFPQGAQS